MQGRSPSFPGTASADAALGGQIYEVASKQMKKRNDNNNKDRRRARLGDNEGRSHRLQMRLGCSHNLP